MTINGPWPSAGVNEDNQCEGTGHMTRRPGAEITISWAAARSLDNNRPQFNPNARDIRKPRYRCQSDGDKICPTLQI